MGFRAFLGPSDQNQLYHTSLLSKIWVLTKNKKIVNDPFKFVINIGMNVTGKRREYQNFFFIYGSIAHYTIVLNESQILIAKNLSSMLCKFVFNRNVTGKRDCVLFLIYGSWLLNVLLCSMKAKYWWMMGKVGIYFFAGSTRHNKGRLQK